MEGSESEAIFDSLNINPQQFINETLDAVDDFVDDAFTFYHQQASTLLKTEGTDRSQDLIKGINFIRNLNQSILDKRLGMWEEYCVEHCFSVPQGFSLPQNNGSSGESSICQDSLSDPDLDARLDSLREKLTGVGKESAELIRDLRALERQSCSRDRCAGLVNEALQLYEENSVHDMFQEELLPGKSAIACVVMVLKAADEKFIEMVRTASELRTKMEKLRTKRTEDIDRIRMEKIYNPNRELTTMNLGKGLPNANLEDLQVFLADLKNM